MEAIDHMLKNYIKTAVRNLLRNKFYSFINISGLAVGLATCLLIWLYVSDELSYDQYNLHANRIYRVNTEIKFGNNFIDLAVASPQTGLAMVHELPDVAQYARLNWFGSIHIRKDNVNLQEDRGAIADSTVFSVFSLPMITGDPSTALVAPHSMVLTETMAKRYFGRTDIVGQSLLVDDSTLYQITGVIRDVPSQSHVHFDFLVPMAGDPHSRSQDWLSSQNYHTYVLLSEHADPRRVQAELNKLMDRHVGPQLGEFLHQSLSDFEKTGGYLHADLTALTDIHLKSNKTGEFEAAGNIQYIYIFSAIALFILLIACVNFMNLSTARSANRSREVGIRKVLGSLKGNLIRQFLAESILVTCIALGVALLIAAVALPYFNQLSGKVIRPEALFGASMLGVLFVLIVVVGVLAGSYPAFFLAAFRPVDVLKGKLAGGFKRSWLRNGLVVFQFAISIALMIGTAVIYSQLNYIRSRDIGFDRSQVMVIEHTEALGNQAISFRNEVSKMVGVGGVTMTPFIPTGTDRDWSNICNSAAMDLRTSMHTQFWTVDENYIPALGMHLLAGRNFSREFPTDSTGLIVNETAFRFLNAGSLPSPGNLIDKKFYAYNAQLKLTVYHIVGVVRDFNFNSMREAVTPLCLTLGYSNENISVRINQAAIPEVTGRIREMWRQMAPSQPFGYSFMDDSFRHLYAAETETGHIAVTFAVLAIVIACLGLFGLITFAAEQRTREIGIRKVLGAGVSTIVTLIARDFLGLVVVASIIAFPIAFWAMSHWLLGFAYRIDISWWIFAGAGLLAILIAAATVSYQAIRAALMNPVESLRTE
jgi:putative ABC transport system permease protein